MAQRKVYDSRRAAQSPMKLQRTVADIVAKACHQAGLQVERHKIDGVRLPSLEVRSKRTGVVVHVDALLDGGF